MKPVPTPTVETEHFWAACARGELIFQRCTRCRRAQYYPRRHCSHCQATELDWETSERAGVIASFTVVHRPPAPEFAADVPYVIALVDMDEGFRMMLNVVDSEAAGIAIGARIRVGFEHRADGFALPEAHLA